MKSIIVLCILAGSLFALPDSIKFDILKTRLVKQMKSSDYKGAIKSIQDLEAMNREMPLSMYYFKAKAYNGVSEYSKSYESLEHYLVKAGKKGKYYNQAIALITDVEPKKDQQLISQKSENLHKLGQEFINLMETGPVNYTKEYFSKHQNNPYYTYKRSWKVKKINSCQFDLIFYDTKTRLQRYIGERDPVKEVEKDKGSYIINFKEAKPKNVYFYDGDDFKSNMLLISTYNYPDMMISLNLGWFKKGETEYSYLVPQIKKSLNPILNKLHNACHDK